MTAILGRMATYTGRTVTWDMGFNSERSLAPEKITGWETAPRTQPNELGLYPLPQPGLLKDVEAAARCGMSVSAFRNWRLRGGGPKFVRLGSAIRYDPRELDRWIADNTCAHTSERR